jgi:hypothetical protein
MSARSREHRHAAALMHKHTEVCRHTPVPRMHRPALHKAARVHISKFKQAQGVRSTATTKRRPVHQALFPGHLHKKPRVSMCMIRIVVTQSDAHMAANIHEANRFLAHHRHGTTARKDHKRKTTIRRPCMTA